MFNGKMTFESVSFYRLRLWKLTFFIYLYCVDRNFSQIFKKKDFVTVGKLVVGNNFWSTFIVYLLALRNGISTSTSKIVWFRYSKKSNRKMVSFCNKSHTFGNIYGTTDLVIFLAATPDWKKALKLVKISLTEAWTGSIAVSSRGTAAAYPTLAE